MKRQRLLFIVFAFALILFCSSSLSYASSQGNVDQATCTVISGWAWDTSNPGSPVNVDIYDGGTKIATVSANGYRADLAGAGIGNGYHAFIYAPTFYDGQAHTITVYFSGTVTALTGTPVMTATCGTGYQGYLDQANNNIISGWAWNAATGATVNLDIYDGSAKIATVSANGYRADLAAAGIGNGYHAFVYAPNLNSGQAHNITVFYSGTSNVLLGNPQGYLDQAACSVISGWAWDTNNPGSAVNLDIYDGNTKITTVSASGYRADLAAIGVGNGYHAFSYAPGFNDGYPHTITVYYTGTSTVLMGTPRGTATCGNAPAATGGGPAGSMTWNIQDSCNNGSSISLKIYDETSSSVWPSSSTHWVLNPGGSYAESISCIIGHQICYGASQANTYWGVGQYNSQACTTCCSTCAAGATVSKNLTCSSGGGSTSGGGGGGGGAYYWYNANCNGSTQCSYFFQNQNTSSTGPFCSANDCVAWANRYNLATSGCSGAEAYAQLSGFNARNGVCGQNGVDF